MSAPHSLILDSMVENKGKWKMYLLRALFFAYENQNQILQLLVETFQRLATATGGNKTAKEVWQINYTFMTDAVNENLKVEAAVSKATEHRTLNTFLFI